MLLRHLYFFHILVNLTTEQCSTLPQFSLNEPWSREDFQSSIFESFSYMASSLHDKALTQILKWHGGLEVFLSHALMFSMHDCEEKILIYDIFKSLHSVLIYILHSFHCKMPLGYLKGQYKLVLHLIFTDQLVIFTQGCTN